MIYGGFDMKEEAPYLKEGAKCGRCQCAIVFWLLLCNGILFSLGIACAAMGIWVQFQPGFQWTAGSVGGGVIATGGFLLLIAIFGVVAACKKKTCLFVFYTTLLTLFLLIQLAAMVLAIVATDFMVVVMQHGWDSMSANQRDGVGIYFGCCQVNPAISAAGQARVDSIKQYTENATNNPLCRDGESEACTIYGLDMAKADGGADDVGRMVTFPSYVPSLAATCAGDGASNSKDTVIPPDCQCQKYDGKGVLCTKADANCAANLEGYQACRNAKAVMPICYLDQPGDEDGNKPDKTNQQMTPFPYVIGLSDSLVNVAGNIPSVEAPMAACYAKFEEWLADNKMTVMLILGSIIVYEIFLLLFSFLLCCRCYCSPKIIPPLYAPRFLEVQGTGSHEAAGMYVKTNSPKNGKPMWQKNDKWYISYLMPNWIIADPRSDTHYVFRATQGMETQIPHGFLHGDYPYEKGTWSVGVYGKGPEPTIEIKPEPAHNNMKSRV